MTDSPAVRLYPTIPGDELRVAFQEHHQKTGTPETFPGLCKSPPADDWDFEIIDDFAIAAARRPGGEMIPCAVCRPNSPKFLEGVLTWDRRDHVLRLIGNACGDAHTIERRADALKRFLRDRRQKELKKELKVYLPLVPLYVERALAAKGAADYASELKEKLKAARTFITRVLDDVNVNGGFTWEEEFVDPQGRRESVRRALPIGGVGVLRHTFSPGAHADKALVGLKSLSIASPAVASAWFNDNALKPDTQADLHKVLMASIKSLDLAEAEIKEAYSFFNEANIKLLQAWTRRRLDLLVRCSTGSTHIVFTGPDREGVKMEAYVRVNDWRLNLPKRELAIRAA